MNPEPKIKTESPHPSSLAATPAITNSSSQPHSSAEMRESLQRQLDTLRTQRQSLESEANTAELRAYIADEQRRIAEAEQRIQGAKTMSPAEFVRHLKRKRSVSDISRTGKQKRSSKNDSSDDSSDNSDDDSDGDSSDDDLVDSDNDLDDSDDSDDSDNSSDEDSDLDSEDEELPRVNYIPHHHTDIDNLHAMILSMEAFFEQRPDVYLNDRRKIRSTLTIFNPEWKRVWEEEKDSRDVIWEPSWHDFCAFFRKRFSAPQDVKRAIQSLVTARQRPNQCMVGYAEYLETWCAYLPSKSPFERKELLRSTVKKRVRLESEKHMWKEHEPDCYVDFVRHMSAIELFVEDPERFLELCGCTHNH